MAALICVFPLTGNLNCSDLRFTWLLVKASSDKAEHFGRLFSGRDCCPPWCSVCLSCFTTIRI